MKSLITLLLFLMSVGVFAENRLSDMIPYPFYESQRGDQNEVMQVTNGIEALQLRLEMIRRAEKNIEVEYFIYNTDLAGKIVTRELIAAAKRGVKVRILIDKSKPIFQFNEFYAKALADHGVEVRYYNKASLFRISTVQFRNHRKLLTVDDKEGITGGRNIGDDYFDLSTHFNFNDTDIYVRGSIVKVMRESFDKYFEHKIAQRPKFPKETEANFEKRLAVEKFLEETEEELLAKKRASEVGSKLLGQNKIYSCPETTFVTDGPGATFKSRLHPKFDERYKFMRKTLFDKLSEVDKSVTISTPYLIANKHSNKLMKSLLKRNVEITVYTNSLASTDAVYVAANLYFDVFRWVKKGINIHLHDGLYIDDNSGLDESIRKAKWGTHSKVQVYESTHSTEAMIGTYNIDNRSNFYNSEMGVFCKGNNEFTQEVKNHILNQAKSGIQINEDGSATDREGNKKSVFGSSKKDLLLMNVIFLPSWLLKFLL
ncbi:MAG: phospholipase D-like domain-containing protein [Bacteriovoracia bacterium]